MTRDRPGFTLLEVVASIMVLAIISVVVMPVVHATLGHYAASVSERAAAERAAFAADRCVRFIREITVDDAGVAGIATAGEEALLVADGSGLELSGQTLLLRTAGGDGHPLCTGVDGFALEYLAADGVTPTADAELIHRVNVTIVVGAVELRAAAFLRGRIGG